MATDDCPLEAMEINVEELERLSQVLHAFSQRTRLGILIGLYHDFTPPEIADALDVSRPGLQSHLDQMREQRLIRRNESGQYVLTPLGEYFAELVENQRDSLIDTLDFIEQEEAVVEEKISEAVNPENVKDWEQVVAAELWGEVSEQVRERLEIGRGEVETDVELFGEADSLEALDSDVLVFRSSGESDNVSIDMLQELGEQGIIEPLEAEPLSNVIDPEALDSIFDGVEDGQRRGLVAFEYKDQLIMVAIDSSGNIISEFDGSLFGVLESDSDDSEVTE